jgi:hypothetical protein
VRDKVRSSGLTRCSWIALKAQRARGSEPPSRTDIAAFSTRANHASTGVARRLRRHWLRAWAETPQAVFGGAKTRGRALREAPQAALKKSAWKRAMTRARRREKRADALIDHANSIRPYVRWARSTQKKVNECARASCALTRFSCTLRDWICQNVNASFLSACDDRSDDQNGKLIQTDMHINSTKKNSRTAWSGSGMAAFSFLRSAARWCDWLPGTPDVSPDVEGTEAEVLQKWGVAAVQLVPNSLA